MVPFVLGLSTLTAALYGGWHVAVKLRSHSVNAMCFGQLFGGLTCFMVAYWLEKPNLSPASCKIILMSGFFHALYLYLISTAYKIGELSVIFPVSRSIGLFIIYALSILSDNLLNIRSIGFIAVLSGTFFIHYQKNSRFLKKDVIFAIIIGILTVFYSLLDRQGIQYMNCFAFSSVVSLSTGFFLLILIPMMDKILGLQKIPLNTLDALFGLGIGISGLIIYSMFLFLLNYMPLSFAMANRQISIFISVFFGRLFFNEKLNTAKIISVSLLLVGILLLNSRP